MPFSIQTKYAENKYKQGDVVSSLFGAGTVGNWCVEAEIATATRTKTFCGKLAVRSCC